MRTYPTINEIEAADREQLGRWLRFLPTPGTYAAANSDQFSGRQFMEIYEREVALIKRIRKRFWGTGGWSPELSRKIGWEDV